MKKYSVPLALAVLLACSAPLFSQTAAAPAAPSSATPEARARELHKLFDDYWQDKLKHNPEYATYLGDKRYDAELTDYSPAAVNDGLARERQYIQRLSSIDTSGLSAQDQLSAQLLLRSLIEDQEAAPFKEWQMPINQYDGPHLQLPQLPLHTSFETVDDYDHYIARLGKVPALFAQLMANMQDGVDAHRTPPRYLMEKVLVQLQNVASQKPADSPFAAPLSKFPAGISAPDRKRISQDLLNVIAQQVLPAYERFARFVGAAYIPGCRTDPGVWAIADGDAYYAFRVRQSTTLKLTPAQIHQIGLDEVQRDEAEMLAIVRKLGFTDLKSFRASLASNPKDHPASSDALLGAYQQYIAQMQPRLPELFGRLPKAKLEVVPMPAYIAPTQPQAFYDQGTPDLKRPGNVDVNLYNWAQRSLADVEAVSYHEGIPGHHLQISLQQEMAGVPQFRQQAYFTAYTEGWALYAERLGKDAGLYKDPLSDYGRLEADMWRAIRLVIDTGVHSKHWTRDQVVEFFHQHSGMDETNIQSEVDRYIAWPAQALGYKMGQLKILELRDRAQKALGPRFNLRAFHDVVLDSGALPLDILEQQVGAWIQAQGGNQRTTAK